MTQLSSNPYICAIFSIAFFVMLYFMGVSSMIGLTETVITFITDLVPKWKTKRPLVIAVTVLILFLVALPMVCQNGIYYFSAWDAYAASYTLVVLALFEVVAVAWLYGTRRFINDIRMMTGPILKPWIETSLQVIWRVV